MFEHLGSLGLPAEFDQVCRSVPESVTGSEFIVAGYQWYKARYNTSKASYRRRNGQVFEGLVLCALQKAGVSPVYYQARVELIPTVVYDILLYDRKRPAVLSCKTSLRERWKQADLEGLALKQVYLGATNYLLTLSEQEGAKVQRRIEDSEVFGLDECIVIKSQGDRFDQLIEELAGRDFTEASPIVPVTGKILSSSN